VLQVAQTADRWLLLRDRALTRLLNLTLLAVAIVVGATLLLGAHLALRLERVRRASDAALSRDGRLRTAFPETAARDELGDVARGFSALLARLADYTDYLRTLAGKLSHEIRTPLTIVRSSLENLESEPLSAGARSLRRARPRGQRAARRDRAGHGRRDARRGGDPRRGAHALRPRGPAHQCDAGLWRRVPAAQFPARGRRLALRGARRAGPAAAGARQAGRQRRRLQSAGFDHPPAAARRGRRGGCGGGRERRPAAAARCRQPGCSSRSGSTAAATTAGRISASASTSCG
jgi:hypothetical protein